MPPYNVMVSECCFLQCHRVQTGSASTPSPFTAHTGALNPSTPLVLHKWQEKERDGGGEKNGRMCLCQGLMRRAIPWIACSMGPPRSLGDVWRGSASHWQETTQLHTISWFFPPPVLPPFLSGHCVLIIFFPPLLQEHIFKLMKSDSYARFLRSNIYQDLLLARKKVSCTLWPPRHWFFFPHKTLQKLSVVFSDQGGLLLKLITDEEGKAVGLGYFVRSTIDQTCA